MSSEPNNIDWEALALASKKDVESAISELRRLISEYDPIEVLSRVAVFILTSNVDEHKDAGGPLKIKTNLEYLVSFVSSQQMPEKALRANPDVTQRVLELLTSIRMRASVYYTSNKARINEGSTPIGDLAKSFRLERLYVRGDGYWPHVRQTMADLLSPHAEKLKEALGFTYHDYLAFMDRTETEIEKRCLAEISEFGKPYRQLIKPWLTNEATGVAQSEECRAFFNANREVFEAAKAEFDRIGTPSLFIMQPQTKAERAIVEALSSEVGTNFEFLGKKAEHSFWPLTPSSTDRRPILSLDNIHYAFNLLNLQQEAYTLIGDLLRERDLKYWERKFLPGRDKYLEQETARLFRIALPGAELMQAVFYPLGTGNDAEADIVVLLGGVLIVIECKASRLDAATRRGGEKKVMSDMRATVVSGLNQAQRLVGELTRCGTLELKVKGQPGVTIEASQFQRVFSINVTLELIPSAAATLWELEDAGLVADTSCCWSVNLNDLRVILEILNSPALFLHYLVRRLDTKTIRQVEANDELNYLMHYVEQGLYFRESNAPKENEHITIVRYTDELDQYYRGLQGIGSRVAKPRVSIGKHTERVLAILEKQRPHNWLIGCIEILEFNVPDREELLGKLSNHLDTLVKKKAAFALSFIASFYGSKGIAIGTSRTPDQVRELVMERCRQHCEQQNIDHMTLLLFGVPIAGAKCEVLNVYRSTEPHRRALLDQLRFEIMELKKRGLNG